MGTRTPRHLIAADYRQPGQPMAPLPLKIPAAAVSRLKTQAERLNCTRAALARTLLLKGLEELEANVQEGA